MHKYRYTILLFITFVVAWAIGRLGLLDAIAEHALRTNSVIYTFVTGAMYSFSFTAGLAVLMFSKMQITQESILPLACIGALGGLLADIFIFKLIKDVILHELSAHTQKVLERAAKNKITKWLLRVVGAVIVASPFPDEIGLSFMGLSKIPFWQLVIVTYILDVIGCYVIIASVAQL